ncbi:Glutathione peroxidase 1 [Mizuhopecten yessoensis]|nr:Glutathione peroxidase 1 [Mizuhopecten yessoensis]
MNELVQKYGDKLVVLGFPCNQFGHQENTKNHEILTALKYLRPGDGFVPKFPIFEKLEVNGKNASEIFVFLRNHLPLPSDDPTSFMKSCSSIIWEPVTRTDLAWNFEKFLITPEGKPYKRFSRYYLTCNLQSEIKTLIEKFNVK